MAKAYSTQEKAAILLITLGKEYSAKLYKYLTDDEIQQLTLAISGVRRVEPEDKESIIDEFSEICMAQNFISEGGIDYAREVLEAALGEQRALELISKLSASLQVRPFDFVRRADAAQVLNLLQGEHPQTIALILSYLPPGKAAMVVESLPPEQQTEVISRIATMGSTNPDYVREAEAILERKLSSVGTEDHMVVGGGQQGHLWQCVQAFGGDDPRGHGVYGPGACARGAGQSAKDRQHHPQAGGCRRNYGQPWGWRRVDFLIKCSYAMFAFKSKLRGECVGKGVR